MGFYHLMFHYIYLVICLFFLSLSLSCAGCVRTCTWQHENPTAVDARTLCGKGWGCDAAPHAPSAEEVAWHGTEARRHTAHSCCGGSRVIWARVLELDDWEVRLDASEGSNVRVLAVSKNIGKKYVVGYLMDLSLILRSFKETRGYDICWSLNRGSSDKMSASSYRYIV
jgi:hypothetical protein